MNLFSLLDKDTVLPQFETNSKKDLINSLVDTLRNKFSSDDELEEVRRAVFEREKIMSTGVGKGIAIPHAKTEVVENNLAAFALLKEPQNFDSIDDEPVRLVFLLISPKTNNSQHIKILSRISRLMNSASFREQITDCENSADILKAFQDEEEKYFVK